MQMAPLGRIRFPALKRPLRFEDEDDYEYEI